MTKASVSRLIEAGGVIFCTRTSVSWNIGHLQTLQQLIRNHWTVRLASTKSDKVRLSPMVEAFLDISEFHCAVASAYLRSVDKLAFPRGPNNESRSCFNVCLQ